MARGGAAWSRNRGRARVEYRSGRLEYIEGISKVIRGWLVGKEVFERGDTGILKEGCA